MPSLGPRSGSHSEQTVDAKTLPPQSAAADVETLSPTPAISATTSPGGAAPERETPAATVPGYEILGELGRGGMGVVYKARHVTLNRAVALKMILAGGHASAQDTARFLSEAEAIAAFQHANIVQVFEVGQHGSLPFMALELVGGGSLADKLRAGPLAPREAADLVKQMAHAMNAAHQAGIVHRDLKPANVLLNVDGTPKITDFGLAKRVEGGSGLTQTGAIMGTPSYMAPEQAAGEGKRVGPAADVYALGAILYECLTGRPPFRAATPLDTVLQVISNDPVPPRQLNARIPRDLQTICLKCLHKEPHQRYASAEALAGDLDCWLTSAPIAARPVGKAERLVKWARRRPALAALVAVSVLATVTVLAGAIYFTDELREERNSAVGEKREADLQRERAKQGETDANQAKKVAEAKTAEVTSLSEKLKTQLKLTEEQKTRAEKSEAKALDLAAKLANELELSKSQTYAAQLMRVQAIYRKEPQDAYELLRDTRVCPLDLRCAAWRFYANQCQWEFLTLQEPSHAFVSFSFSSDGKTLVSASADGTVRVWDAQSGKELTAFKAAAAPVNSVVVSPDARLVAVTGKDQTIAIWSVQNKRELTFLKGHKGPVHSLSFDAQGKTLASASEDKSMKIWDVQNGRELDTFRWADNSLLAARLSPDARALAAGNGKHGVISDADGQVNVWSVLTRAGIANFTAPMGGGGALAFSADSRMLAAGGRSGEIKIWDFRAGQLVSSLKEVSGLLFPVSCVAFSPDGKMLASSGLRNTVKLWDVKSGQELITLRGHTSPVLSISFNPDGTVLASASVDKTLKLWQIKKGSELLVLKNLRDTGRATALSFDARTKATTSDAGRTVQLWDTKVNQEIALVRGLHLAVPSTPPAETPDGKIRASAFGKDIKLWDLASGKELKTLTGSGTPAKAIAFSHDAKTLAVGSPDGTVTFWDVQTYEKLGPFRGHSLSVQSLSFSPDGDVLLSAGSDQNIVLWDAKSQEKLAVLEGHAGPIWSVAYGPDGKTFASAGKDRTIRLWNARTREVQATLRGHSDQIMSLCYSPDSKTLATGGLDRTVRLWNVKSGQELATLMDDAWIVSVRFSEDGMFLGSAADNGTVKIWDMRR